MLSQSIMAFIDLICPPGWKPPSRCNPSSRSEPTSTYCSSSRHLRFILPSVWHFPSHHVSQGAAGSLTPQSKLAAKPKPKRALTRQEPHSRAWGKWHSQKEIRTHTKVAHVYMYTVYGLNFVFVFWAGEATWSCESPDPSNGCPSQEKNHVECSWLCTGAVAAEWPEHHGQNADGM